MSALSHISAPQQQLSCPVSFVKKTTETRLIARWLTDKEGKLFRCWVREAIPPK